jgi:hypothetical protein
MMCSGIVDVTLKTVWCPMHPTVKVQRMKCISGVDDSPCWVCQQVREGGYLQIPLSSWARFVGRGTELKHSSDGLLMSSGQEKAQDLQEKLQLAERRVIQLEGKIFAPPRQYFQINTDMHLLSTVEGFRWTHTHTHTHALSSTSTGELEHLRSASLDLETERDELLAERGRRLVRGGGALHLSDLGPPEPLDDKVGLAFGKGGAGGAGSWGGLGGSSFGCAPLAAGSSSRDSPVSDGVQQRFLLVCCASPMCGV